MKNKLISLAVILFSTSVLGQSTIPLAWDPSPTASVTNYVLYAHTNSLSMTNLSAACVRQSVGTNTVLTLTNILPGFWWFTVTAVNSGIESVPSNVVMAEVPKPPANLRVVALQYSVSLTNWVDVGFFRIKFGQ